MLLFTDIKALQTTKVIKLTLSISKASYLPFKGSRYIQNGKIMENTGLSTSSVPRCPHDYPEKQAALCYKPCKRPSDWAFVKPVGPVCWGCPSSHPSEEVALCYKNCPRDKPHKSTFNCFGNCPSGYRNDGLTCFRDAHIFGSDNSACPWYDKCGLTFSKGCSKCPSGYKNDGCTCRRNPHAISRPSYNRGVGVVLRSQGRGVGKPLLLFATYEEVYDKPACSIGNWKAISFAKDSTEVLKFVNDDQRVIVFAFRGTDSAGDWFKNIQIVPSSTTINGTTFGVHQGFKNYYTSAKNWFKEQYRSAIRTGYRIIITGHSLGGAAAFIAAGYAAGDFNHVPDAVVTYGAPITGNEAFGNYYKSVVGCDRTLRFTTGSDIIPTIPKAFGYKHFCPATKIGSGGDFLSAHNLYVGYQEGIANKYKNHISAIDGGCDFPL